MEEDRVREALGALIELLEGLGEPHASSAAGLGRLDLMVEEARDRDSADLLQQAVRTIIRLYGGMGSFADVVLMESGEESGRRRTPS